MTEIHPEEIHQKIQSCFACQAHVIPVKRQRNERDDISGWWCVSCVASVCSMKKLEAETCQQQRDHLVCLIADQLGRRQHTRFSPSIAGNSMIPIPIRFEMISKRTALVRKEISGISGTLATVQHAHRTRHRAVLEARRHLDTISRKIKTLSRLCDEKRRAIDLISVELHEKRSDLSKELAKAFRLRPVISKSAKSEETATPFFRIGHISLPTQGNLQAFPKFKLDAGIYQVMQVLHGLSVYHDIQPLPFPIHWQNAQHVFFVDKFCEITEFVPIVRGDIRNQDLMREDTMVYRWMSMLIYNLAYIMHKLGIKSASSLSRCTFILERLFVTCTQASDESMKRQHTPFLLEWDVVYRYVSHIYGRSSENESNERVLGWMEKEATSILQEAELGADWNFVTS